MAADLSPATRTALLEILEGFEQVLGMIGKLTQACEGLDRLDDLRNQEIQELRLTVRLLCHAQGIDTTGSPLVQLVQEYSKRAEPEQAGPSAEQTVYWSELEKLRAQRAALEAPAQAPAAGRTIEPHEQVPDEHGNSVITFGDGTGAVHTAEGWFMVAMDDA